MDGHSFTLAGAQIVALGSGALWWPDERLLCVSDLHLGQSEHTARRGGSLLPAYETRDTLNRLAADLARTNARIMVCLGDSFDGSNALPEEERLWIARLQAGRRWIWISGPHNPGPVSLGGAHLAELLLSPLTFRHIARATASGEISGYYHPKATIQTDLKITSRPAFLADSDRIILPSYGCYTGGLETSDKALTPLMRPEAIAILTGRTPHAIPMPR